MKICMISDTHEQHSKVEIPKCDLLIHAGDITGRGALQKLNAFNTWLETLLADGVVGDVVYIAGNHDISLQDNREVAEGILLSGNYLNNSMAYVGPADEQKCVFGIPDQLPFNDLAFNTPEPQLARMYKYIPDEVDILVTHGPPLGVLDENNDGHHCGSKSLLDWIKSYQPRLVVCGHIHEGYGIALVDNTLVVNASTCTSDYKPTNQPIVLEL